MTTAAKPDTIPTTQGEKLRQCPDCDNRVELNDDGLTPSNAFRTYWCQYCEVAGWVIDLPDAPEMDGPTIGRQCDGLGNDGSPCYGVKGYCPDHR